MSEKPKILESRVAYDGKIFQAVVERVRMPDREKDSRSRSSVTRVRLPWLRCRIQTRWCSSGSTGTRSATISGSCRPGSIDPGEDAETAARRECHEELGLIAGAAERLGEAWPLPGYCTEYMTFFRLTDLRLPGADDAEAHQDEDEQIETQVFTLEQVRAMMRSGEIKDLKTAAVLALL